MRRFSPGVKEELDHYVYRLIDPRDGHTFYVGRGRGDRVFDHVADALSPDAEEDDERLKRVLIQDLHGHGLEPLHVIHRHGLESEDVARIVEAAVIDAFPNLTNRIAGYGSGRFGPATAEQLNERYAPEEIPKDRPVVVIKITQRGLRENDGNVYQTVRSAWVMGERRLRTINSTAHHVLAILDGLCIGVYSVRPGSWGRHPTEPKRCEFDGTVADEEMVRTYKRKRFADRSQFPIRVFGF